MTEASLSAPVTERQPKPPTNSIFRHAIYVVADNPVTGLAFALFVLIALGALVALSGICDRKRIEQAVRAEAPRSFLDLNLDALKAGFALHTQSNTTAAKVEA